MHFLMHCSVRGYSQLCSVESEIGDVRMFEAYYMPEILSEAFLAPIAVFVHRVRT